MARDECWDALKEHARQNHKERVAKNPDRIEYNPDVFAPAEVGRHES